MKKYSLFVLGAILFSGGAYAEFQETVTTVTSEPVGANAEIVTVTQVKEMSDDTPVVLQGYIVQRIGDEKYLFQDATDSITIEIDDNNWRGVNVIPSETVKIYGTVDSGMFNTEVDVESVELINQ